MNTTKIETLDTDFYIERAYELRREYVAVSLKSVFANIKAALKGLVKIAPVATRPAH